VAIDEATGQIVGVGRYATDTGGGVEAGMALAVTDAWQQRGIGHGLAVRLIARARANGITRLTGSTLVDNVRARSLLARLGFRVSAVNGDVLDVELDVEEAQPRRYRGARRTSGSSSRELRASFANTRVR
jgi:N-acetylglutamate synthase-like GNAT family acetyltransferase